MLGEDQRYQNGFDCQGLWVEVNVERDLGFTSKRDIEAYGIAEFVHALQAARPDLRRPPDRAVDPARACGWTGTTRPSCAGCATCSPRTRRRSTTIEGPDGPVTDTVEMLVGRLGMPDVGGSYFTFSNENNDLIWGFLAECHRRGWLYKGHDTMPWCPRCGTGLSQMEMNEGYQDREDPGLTVRFPLVDRPGESLLVWTTTPWTLTSNVAAAVGPDLRYVRVRQGDDVFWLGKGTLKTGARGAVRGRSRRSAGRGARRLALRRARSTTCRRSRRRSRDGRLRAPRRRRGTRSARTRAPASSTSRPGCGAEDFQLGKALGLPVIAPIDEDGLYLRRASAG